MTKQFEDIRIIAIDDKASRPSGQGALMDIVLRLSQIAPPEWADYFDDAWKQHIYMTKRNASASGNQITITCIPDDLESDHIPELKKVIADTNKAYGAYHAAKLREEQTAAEQARKQSETLSNLKKNIKFD